MIHWQDLHHSELTVPQLYALLKLRCEVFVVEQRCPYLDVDGDDLISDNRHILGWHHDELVAYARILKSNRRVRPGGHRPGDCQRRLARCETGSTTNGENSGIL